MKQYNLKNGKRLAVAFLLVVFINMVFLEVMELAGLTYGWILTLMLVMDFLLYWHADRRYFAFIHSILMTVGVAGMIWIGIWDVKSLIAFIKAWPDPVSAINIGETLYMMLVGICSAGLYFLGIHYIGRHYKQIGKL